MGILKNTCHMISTMLYLSYDNEGRSKYDGRTTPSITQRARVESFHPNTLREKIPLRSKVENATGLYWSCITARGNNRGPGLREAGQGKIKATSWWQPTIKFLATFRSPHMPVYQTARDDPWKARAIFSITACPMASQWLYKNGYAKGWCIHE
jgi:hypothetical protein